MLRVNENEVSLQSACTVVLLLCTLFLLAKVGGSSFFGNYSSSCGRLCDTALIRADTYSCMLIFSLPHSHSSGPISPSFTLLPRCPALSSIDGPAGPCRSQT